MTTRQERALTDRLFLVDTREGESEYKMIFDVMGSTGNLYTVAFSSKPTCTCPDFVRRKSKCKHIYFIHLKALKGTHGKKRFSNKELKDLFSNIPSKTSQLLVSENLREAYQKLQNENQSTSEEIRREISPEDICPVCLEDLNEGESDFCRYGCGKSIHRVCYEMWTMKNQATCVYCRADWIREKTNKFKGNYINLLDLGRSNNIREGEELEEQHEQDELNNLEQLSNLDELDGLIETETQVTQHVAFLKFFQEIKEELEQEGHSGIEILKHTAKSWLTLSESGRMEYFNLVSSDMISLNKTKKTQKRKYNTKVKTRKKYKRT